MIKDFDDLKLENAKYALSAGMISWGEYFEISRDACRETSVFVASRIDEADTQADTQGIDEGRAGDFQEDQNF